LDVFSESPRFLKTSREALLVALAEGSLVACDVVWAEARAHFSSYSAFERSMATLGVLFDACDQESAAIAGDAWKRYREAGGPRDAIISDFLVAGHAMARADRLATRDRGFTRTYFARLKILDSSGSSRS
jgi:predicted nucleic acid-binding protein